MLADLYVNSPRLTGSINPRLRTPEIRRTWTKISMLCSCCLHTAGALVLDTTARHTRQLYFWSPAL